MINLNIILDGDNAWPDLKEKEYIVGDFTAVAYLSHGMASGKPSVALRIELPDGRTVLAQTTATLWLMAATAFKGRAEYEGTPLE